MTAWGVMMVRDEADIIEASVRHALWHLDGVIVADNLSADGTSRILDQLTAEFPQLLIMGDDVEAYRQSEKTTALGRLAAETDPDLEWVVPIDADETWRVRGRPYERVADLLACTDWNVAYARTLNHVVVEGVDVVGGLFGSSRMPYRIPGPGPLPKVALRWEHGAVIDQGNHGCSLPSCPSLPEYDPDTAVLEIRHFQYRSRDQLARKVRTGAAAYRAAVDLPEMYGTHWREYDRIIAERGEDGIDEIWAGLSYTAETVDRLVYDPATIARAGQ